MTTHLGKEVSASDLAYFDAVVLATGTIMNERLSLHDYNHHNNMPFTGVLPRDPKIKVKGDKIKVCLN